jgi:hypothetical protein
MAMCPGKPQLENGNQNGSQHSFFFLKHNTDGRAGASPAEQDLLFVRLSGAYAKKELGDIAF